MQFISKARDLKALHMIVYEGGFASVNEKRTINLSHTTQWLRIEDLPKLIETSSLIIHDLEVNELTIERNKGLSENYLLRFVQGEKVLFQFKDQPKTQYRLLEHSPDLILEDVDSKEVLINPKGELSLIAIPEKALSSPVVECRVHVNESIKKAFMFTYLTEGLQWQAQYKAILSNGHLTLSGWIEVKNSSGTSFYHVFLQTMAGITSRVRGPEPKPEVMMVVPSQQVTEETVGELHLFTIPFPVDILDRQQKQIQFMQEKNIPYRLFYVVTSHDKHPLTTIEWQHKEKIPLAKGIIKLYYQKENGNLFAGEERMPYTAPASKVQIEFGRAVDISSEHVILRRYIQDDKRFEEHAYTFYNAKDEAVLVIVKQPVFQEDWDLVNHSADIVYKTANELQLSVTLKSKETRKITFTIKMKINNRV
ncbi:DUF4139 domain-containing protein [Jeotgalibacillus soli]|uniref:DUF4139 domain-containing protein n=1 Tax=Jeotgalibacillus soli TaxID=889306 RepID=A0A0C2VLS5_9BACL|nr:hypothetical protein [Jeotgalibacillus soli]KIL45416.1 hypothetical protein KP78_29600 [Jeotgalibacillus soli]